VHAVTVALENVTIRYGSRVAVRDLSVEFPRGAVALLGRNGAGKTSVLKALLGLVRPASGRARILDLPDGASPEAIRARVGYMPERDAHLPQTTGFEMVALLGMLSGMPRPSALRRAHEVLYIVDLEDQRYRPVGGYSAGMRQKVKLAAALVHDPQLLFLDEPTNGLDPQGRAEMLGLVGQLSRELGKSIVLSTHILQDVETVCDAAVVMEKGAVVAQGTLQQLTGAGAPRHTMVVEPAGVELPASLPGGLRLSADGPGRYTVWLPEPAATEALFAAVLAAGGRVRSLIPHRRSLEDVFLGVVRPAVAAAAEAAARGPR
jgi:ABC-2 type transport system ATP-binding protein